MNRPVALFISLAVYFTVTMQGQCIDNIGTVVKRIDDLSVEMVQMKGDIVRVEDNIINQINLAKISLKLDLMQDIKQHVRDAITEILQEESIEKMVRSQIVSEVRELKRERHHMKGQLRHVLDTVRDLKEERDTYKDRSLNQKDATELKCIVLSEERIAETQFRKSNITSLEQSVTHLSRALQTTRTEQEFVKMSLNTTGQDIMSIRSKLKHVDALLNTTRKDLLSRNSELTNVQESTNATEQDLLSIKSKLEMVQTSLSTERQELLATNSELVTVKSTIGSIESEVKDKVSRLNTLERRTVDLVNITNKIIPVIYFKAFSKNDQYVTKGSTITFEHVVTNKGNGYDPRTGVFTAPISGLYLLSAILGTKGSGAGDFAIKNQHELEAKIAIKDQWDVGPMTTLAHVAKGNHVTVIRAWGGSKALRGGRWTQFSGFLLRVE